MKLSLVPGAVAAVLAAGAVHADTSSSRIAFSNNYAGNSWRQAMLKSYDAVTKKAVADGVVAAADVFTTADQEVPTQAAADPEPDPAGLQRHRHQRRLAGRAQRRRQAGLRRRHRRGLLRRHRHRALRLPRGRRLRGHGQAGGRADGQVPAQGREPARDPRPRRHLDRRRHPQGHRGRRRRPSRVQDRELGHRQLGPDHGAEGGDHRAALAARHRRHRRPGRRRLRRGPGLRRRRQAAPDHHHGQPPGRARPGGRSRRTRTATPPGRPRSRRASRRSPSGWRSRCSTAAPTSRTTCWCPYLAFTQDDFEAALPTIEKGGVASHEYTQEEALAAIKANLK